MLALEVISKVDRNQVKELRFELRAAGKDAIKAGKNITQSFLKGGRAADKMAGSVSKAGSLINKKMIAAAATVGGVIVSLRTLNRLFDELVQKPLIEARFMETAELRLDAFTASVDETLRRLAFLEEFADVTPFQLNELVKVEQRMLAFGGAALATEKHLKNLGDTSALFGPQIENLTFWFTRAYNLLQDGKPIGEVQVRLGELGVAIPGLSDKIVELQHTGGTFNDTWELFITQFERAEGAMEKLSQTIDGKLSTLRDKIAKFRRDIGQAGLEQSFSFALTEFITAIDAINRETEIAANIGIGLTNTFFGTAKAGLELVAIFDIVKFAIEEMYLAWNIAITSWRRDNKQFELDVTTEWSNIANTFRDFVLDISEWMRGFASIYDTLVPTANLTGKFDQAMRDLENITFRLGEATLDYTKELEELDRQIVKISLNIVKHTFDQKRQAELINKINDLEKKRIEIIKEVNEEREKRKKLLEESNAQGEKENEVIDALTKAHVELRKSLEDQILAQKILNENYGESPEMLKLLIALSKLKNVSEEFRHEVLGLQQTLENEKGRTKALEDSEKLKEAMDRELEQYKKLTIGVEEHEEALFNQHITQLRLNGESELYIANLIHWRLASQLAKDATKEQTKELDKQTESLEDWRHAFVQAFIESLRDGRLEFDDFLLYISNAWQDTIKTFEKQPELFGDSQAVEFLFGSETGAKIAQAVQGLSVLYGLSQNQYSEENALASILSGGLTGFQVGGIEGAIVGAAISAITSNFLTGGDWQETGREIALEIHNGAIEGIRLFSLQEREGGLFDLFQDEERSREIPLPTSLERFIHTTYQDAINEIIELSDQIGIDGAKEFISSFTKALSIELKDIPEGQEQAFLEEYFRNLESQIIEGIIPFSEISLFRRHGEDFVDTFRRMAEIIPAATAGLEKLGINIESSLSSLVDQITQQLIDQYVSNLDLIPDFERPDIGEGYERELIPENLPEQIQNLVDEFVGTLSDEELLEAARLKFKELFIEALGGAEEATEKIDRVASTFRSASDILQETLTRMLSDTTTELNANLETLGISLNELMTLSTEGMDPETLALLVEARSNLALIMQLERDLAVARGEAIQVTQLTVDQLNEIKESLIDLNSALFDLGASIPLLEQDFLDFAAFIGEDFGDKLFQFYQNFAGDRSLLNSLFAGQNILSDFGITLGEVINSQGSILIDLFERFLREGNTELAARVVNELGPVGEFLLNTFTELNDAFILLGISIEDVDLESLIKNFGSLENAIKSINGFLTEMSRIFPQESLQLDEGFLRDILFNLGLNLEDVIARNGEQLYDIFNRAIETGNFALANLILNQLLPQLDLYVDSLRDEEQVKLRLIELNNQLNEIGQTIGVDINLDPELLERLAETLGISLVEAAELLNNTLLATVTESQELENAIRVIEDLGYSVDEFVNGGLEHYQALLLAAIALGDENLIKLLLSMADSVHMVVNAADQFNVDNVTDGINEISEELEQLLRSLESAINNVNRAIDSVRTQTIQSFNTVGAVQSRIDDLYAGLGSNIENDIESYNRIAELIVRRFEIQQDQIFQAGQILADQHNALIQQEINAANAAHQARIAHFEAEMRFFNQLESNVRAARDFVDEIFGGSAGGILPQRRYQELEESISQLLPDVLSGREDTSSLFSLLREQLELASFIGGTPLRQDVLDRILAIQELISESFEDKEAPKSPEAQYLPQIAQVTAQQFANTQALTELERETIKELERLREEMEAREAELLAQEQAQRELDETRRVERVRREEELNTNTRGSMESTFVIEREAKNQTNLMQSHILVTARMHAGMIEEHRKLREAVQGVSNTIDSKEWSPVINVTVNSGETEENLL